MISVSYEDVLWLNIIHIRYRFGNRLPVTHSGRLQKML